MLNTARVLGVSLRQSLNLANTNRSTALYLGYDFYDIGPTQIAGLVAGVRLWY